MLHRFIISIIAIALMLIAIAVCDGQETRLLCGPNGCSIAPPQPRVISPYTLFGRDLKRWQLIAVEATKGKQVSCGSGVFIKQAGRCYALTCWHVVKDGGVIVVRTASGTTIPVTIVATDNVLDLALLDLGGRNVPCVEMAAAVSVGECVTSCGFGSGSRARVVQGQVAQILSADRRSNVFFEWFGASRPGDSGGPVFNISGRLVGILFGAKNGRSNGTRIGAIRGWLARVVRRPDHVEEAPKKVVIPAQPPINWSPPKQDKPTLAPIYEEGIQQILDALPTGKIPDLPTKEPVITVPDLPLEKIKEVAPVVVAKVAAKLPEIAAVASTAGLSGVSLLSGLAMATGYGSPAVLLGMLAIKLWKRKENESTGVASSAVTPIAEEKASINVNGLTEKPILNTSLDYARQILSLRKRNGQSAESLALTGVLWENAVDLANQSDDESIRKAAAVLTQQVRDNYARVVQAHPCPTSES